MAYHKCWCCLPCSRKFYLIALNGSDMKGKSLNSVAEDENDDGALFCEEVIELDNPQVITGADVARSLVSLFNAAAAPRKKQSNNQSNIILL